MNIISKYLIILLCTYLFSQNVSAQSDRQYIRSGNNFYRQENHSKAEIEFRKALNKKPQNPQALYNLGCALLQQKKDSLAILQLQYAGKLETSKIRKAMIFHNIGVICQRHHLFGEAIEAYKESLRNNPLDNETRYNLVLCMRQRKPNNNKEIVIIKASIHFFILSPVPRYGCPSNIILNRIARKCNTALKTVSCVY